MAPDELGMAPGLCVLVSPVGPGVAPSPDHFVDLAVHVQKSSPWLWVLSGHRESVPILFLPKPMSSVLLRPALPQTARSAPALPAS